MERPTFALRIKEARTSLGLTQAGFAELLEVHRVQVAKWENGTNKPYPATLQRIAEATGRPVGWLSGEDDTVLLDLRAKLSPVTLERLTDRAAGNDRSLPDEAAAVLTDALSGTE